MGQSKRNLLRFLSQNPKCCFCGGDRPASTQDHWPPRAIFHSRRWPEGFVFPACLECNGASRKSEKIMATILYSDNDDQDNQRFKKNLESVARDYPDLLSSMLPKNANEIRKTIKEHGIEKPKGLAFADLPIIKLERNFWTEHVQIFAKKMLLALHYQCFGVPLSHNGAIWIYHYTNFDLIADRVPESIFRLPENVVIPMRQKTLLDHQFSLKWGHIKGTKTGLFVMHFHNKFMICGITTEEPEKLSISNDFAPVKPFDWR